MTFQVVTYYLEMTDRSQMRPARRPPRPWRVVRAELACPELNRFFYNEVGGRWRWVDRAGWTDEHWARYVERPELETWVAYASGTPVGYFELESQPSDQVQIMYFGLLPRFIGQGFGGSLLTAAIERSWAIGPSRVWVHTCNLDHPGALPNYLARGFRIYEEKHGAG